MTRTAFFIVLLLGVVCALCLTSCDEPVKNASTQGWACSGDLLPGSQSVSLYLIVAPDGQQFLTTSRGGLLPYTPKMVPAPVEKTP